MTVCDLWDVSSDGKVCVRVDGDILGLSKVDGVVVGTDWRGNAMNVGGRVVTDVVVTSVAGYGTVILATVY